MLCITNVRRLNVRNDDNNNNTYKHNIGNAIAYYAIKLF